MVKDTYESVSYTHLDVYKRQAYRLLRKWIAIDGRMELNVQSTYAKISPRINANGICDIF